LHRDAEEPLHFLVSFPPPAVCTAPALVRTRPLKARHVLRDSGNTVDVGFAKLRIPALASGGTMHAAGVALVGEAGPEVVTVPEVRRPAVRTTRAYRDATSERVAGEIPGVAQTV
jgi:hypothetical protein